MLHHELRTGCPEQPGASGTATAPSSARAACSLFEPAAPRSPAFGSHLNEFPRGALELLVPAHPARGTCPAPLRAVRQSR
eukprot:9989843-Alexandrium_andersonii.AAC.1